MENLELIEFVKADGKTKILVNGEKETLLKAKELGWKPSRPESTKKIAKKGKDD